MINVKNVKTLKNDKNPLKTAVSHGIITISKCGIVRSFRPNRGTISNKPRFTKGQLVKAVTVQRRISKSDDHCGVRNLFGNQNQLTNGS